MLFWLNYHAFILPHHATPLGNWADWGKTNEGKKAIGSEIPLLFLFCYLFFLTKIF